MKRWLYRTRQFWHALTARVDGEDLWEIQTALTPALQELFYRLQAGEQAHSLWVFRRLRGQNETHADLMTAALLHDVGKSLHPLGLWERVEIVLARKIAPQAVERWGNASPVGWRKPFVVAAQHPAWGAELAQQAGATPLAAALIRRHQEKLQVEESAMGSEEDFLLARLQKFDDES